jgi:hypothetical protein
MTYFSRKALRRVEESVAESRFQRLNRKIVDRLRRRQRPAIGAPFVHDHSIISSDSCFRKKFSTITSQRVGWACSTPRRDVVIRARRAIRSRSSRPSINWIWLKTDIVRAYDLLDSYRSEQSFQRSEGLGSQANDVHGIQCLFYMGV